MFRCFFISVTIFSLTLFPGGCTPRTASQKMELSNAAAEKAGETPEPNAKKIVRKKDDAEVKWVLSPTEVYQLNYINDFRIEAVYKAKSEKFERDGLKSILHHNFSDNDKSDNITTLTINGNEFTINVAPNPGYEFVVYLSAELEFEGENDKKFVFFSSNESLLKVFLNDILILMNDRSGLKSEFRESSEITLNHGRNRVFIKLSVPESGVARGKLLLSSPSDSFRFEIHKL